MYIQEWLIVGEVIWWLADHIVRAAAQLGLLFNVVLAIVVVEFGGWLILPPFRVGNINSGDFSVIGLLVSLMGAAIYWRSSTCSAVMPYANYRPAGTLQEGHGREWFAPLLWRAPNHTAAHEQRRKRRTRSLGRRHCPGSYQRAVNHPSALALPCMSRRAAVPSDTHRGAWPAVSYFASGARSCDTSIDA